MKPRPQNSLSLAARSSSLLGLCTVTFCALTAGHALAQATWDGGGSDANWSTGLNWATDTAPSGTVALIFNGALNTSSNNDITGLLSSISFQNTSGPGFTLGGSAVTLNGNIISNQPAADSTLAHTINMDLILNGNRTISPGRTSGKISTITINGAISGAFSLTKTAFGELILTNANNSFSSLVVGGNTTGNVKVTSISNKSVNSAIGGGTSLTFDGGALVYTGSTAGITDRDIILIGGGGAINNSGTAGQSISFNGTATNSSAGAKTMAFGGDVGDANVFAGSLANNTGALALSKSGTSTWILSGNNTYTGQTDILAGTISISKIADAGPDSNLGNAGIIRFGSGNGGGTLLVTGSAGTTGRTVQIGSFNGANGGGGATIIQNGASGGSGLRFTAATFNTQDINASVSTRSLSLQGANTDANEIAGVIQNTVNSAGSNTPVEKSGVGLWIISGVNTYTGNTTVNAGTLRIGNTRALGFGGIQRTAATANTTVNLGSTLDLNGQLGVSEPLILSGTGMGGNGALINSSGTGATIVSGIAGIQLLTATTGSGYSAVPTVNIAGTGSGATAVATLGVTAATFGAPTVTGTITGTPTVSISGGGGTGATATINSAGVITITNPGTGFTSLPTITVTAAGGTITYPAINAANFTVSGVSMTAAGSGYTGTPTYTFGGGGNAVPGFVALSSVTLAADSRIGGAGDISIAAAVGQSGGTRALTKVGAGTLTLSSASNTYGPTIISGGTLKYGVASAIPSASAVTLNSVGTAVLDLSGFNGTIGSLSFGGAAGAASTAQTVQTGAGTLTLGGNVSTTATGDPTTAPIITGNLDLGAAQRNFSVADSSGSVLDLDVSATITGSVLAGSTQLAKTGAGTLKLSGPNSYVGNTRIEGGTLVAANDSAFGTGNLTLINTGSVLELANGITIDRALSIDNAGDKKTLALQSSATSATYSGAITNSEITAGNFEVLVGTSGTLTLSAAVSNNTITKVGSGILVLSGSTDNSGLLLNATEGQVNLDKSAAAGVRAVAGISGIGNGATVKLTGVGTDQIFGGSGTNQGVNGIVAGGTLDLNGKTESVSFLNGSGGTVDGAGAGGSGESTLTVGETNVSASFAGVIKNTTGSLKLTKTGTGTQTLSGPNTYSGATTISGGKLLVTDSIGNSAVTVSASGAILATDTAATIGSTLAVNNGAILAVGDAANAATATATVLGATTFNNGSIFSWDINAAGTSYDKLVTTGLTDGGPAGGTVFRIVAAEATFANAFWTTNQTWADVFTTDGSAAIANWATVFGNTVTVVNSSFASITPSAGSFSITGSSLTWTAVPEPTSALAGLLITAGLLRRRRA